MFYEEADKQPVVLSFQSVVSYLKFLKLVLTDLNLVDFAVKPIQSVVLTKQPTDFFNCLNQNFVKFVKSALNDLKLIWLLQ